MEQKDILKKLLEAVEGSNQSEGQKSTPWRATVDLFGASHKSHMIEGVTTKKKQQSSLLDSLEHMNKRTAERFFTSVDAIVSTIVSERRFINLEKKGEEGDDGDDYEETFQNKERRECLIFLEFAARSANKMLAVLQERHEKPNMTQMVQAGSPLYSVAIQLHDVLISIHECGDAGLSTKEAVVELCEKWWLSSFPNRDTLIPQVLPLLVLDAYEAMESHKKHIKKVHQFTDAFQAIDFSNPSSDSLRSLLFKLATSPACLNLAEGRAFLASLMRDADLASDLHQVFKMQVPRSSKSILMAFADIYRKAWKAVSNEDSMEGTQENFEQTVLQDLMYSAIHLSSDSMVSSLHVLLEPFHEDNKSPEIASLLHRLYGPILWRSLSASNARVRKNAIMILERTFPLNDPEQDSIKAVVEKGCEALFKALQDVCPTVRVAASEASSKICVLFWSVLSAARIRKIITLITIKHASDKSSAAVRAAAVRSVVLMLGSRETHAVLRPLLPSLGNLIHDKSEKVRLATIDLLRCIKVIPDIKFYHVVSVEHLNARLVEEEIIHQSAKNKVAGAIASLLLSSYFPQGQGFSASDQLKRALSFMINEPKAAAVFYSNLSGLLERSSIARFALMLQKCLQSAIEADGSASMSEMDDTDNSIHVVARQQLSVSNTSLMLLLAETLSSLVGELVDEGYDKSELRRKLGLKKLLNTWEVFDGKAKQGSEGEEIDSEIYRKHCIQICAVTVKCITSVSEGRDRKVLRLLFASMRNELERDDCDLNIIMPHLSLLVSFDMVPDLVSWLTKAIKASCEPGQLDSWNGNKRKRKKQEEESIEIPPKHACTIADLVLRGESACSIRVREGILASGTDSDRLLQALNNGIRIAEQILDNEMDPNQVELNNMFHCCELYGRFSLHVAAFQNDEVSVNDSLQTLLTWTEKKVLPTFLRFSRMTLHNLDISRISNMSDSLCLGDNGEMEKSVHEIDIEAHTDKDSQTLTERTARALFHSVCAVLSEFITIGEESARTVSRHVHRWFKLLGEAIDLDRSDRCKMVLEDTLSPLLRLCIQFATRTENFSLLKELFMVFDWDLPSSAKDQLRQGMLLIIKDRSRRADIFLNGLVGSFLDASEDLFEKFKLDDLNEDDAQGFWVRSGEHAVGVVLDVIREHKRSCDAFTNEARHRLRSHSMEGSSVGFHETCLSIAGGVEVGSGN